MDRIVSIDGELVPPDRAFISVFDRGFLYGDSVYEVVRTYRRVPFELQAHLSRLARSAQLIALSLPWALERIAREIVRAIAATDCPEAYVRVIVTRGEGELGLDPALARGGRVIIIVKPLVVPPDDAYLRGVLVALVDVRRNLREAIDPAAKTGNYLNNVLAVNEARRQGAYEALMLDHAGRITEGSSSNFFLVQKGRLLTPPLEVGILEGVTRRVVLELAREASLTIEERDLLPEDLLASDEVFLTSTTRELVPVTLVSYRESSHSIGAGKPGPVTLLLLRAFRERAARGAVSPPVPAPRE
jgi:branched-chain amino acid aminotransferase